jgi:hypothetical protein
LPKMPLEIKLSKYPKIKEFLLGIRDYKNTFLYDRASNDGYAFWPHFEHFLAHRQQINNHETILKNLSVTAPFDMEIEKSWEKWRTFRSAQHEVTVIFLIEHYLSGKVLEIIPKNKNPTPDLKVDFGGIELFIEVKSESGQQHSDQQPDLIKHPREKGPIHFEPKDENDLKCWLFEKRVSKRTNRPMIPMIVKAEQQGADILAAFTDYFPSISDIESRVKLLSENSSFIKALVIKNLVMQFFQAEFPFSNKRKGLGEIWLLNDSSLDELIVLSEKDFLLTHIERIAST